MSSSSQLAVAYSNVTSGWQALHSRGHLFRISAPRNGPSQSGTNAGSQSKSSKWLLHVSAEVVLEAIVVVVLETVVVVVVAVVDCVREVEVTVLVLEVDDVRVFVLVVRVVVVLVLVLVLVLVVELVIMVVVVEVALVVVLLAVVVVLETVVVLGTTGQPQCAGQYDRKVLLSTHMFGNCVCTIPQFGSSITPSHSGTGGQVSAPASWHVPGHCP